MGLTQSFLDPPPGQEEGWTGTFDSFGRPEGVRLKESKPLEPLFEEESFDDTFKLREAAPPQNSGRFARGVPTNDKTSSKNYPADLVKMIDGEHKTLLHTGKINEAMEGDIHDSHILEHRMLLASDDLSESQRNALLEHISSHLKSKKQQQKIVENATTQGAKQGQYVKGLGFVSKPKPPIASGHIPQDDPQSAERKRTAGMISMEADRERKFGIFHKAVTRASRRGL